MHNFDADSCKKIERGNRSVGLCVIDFLDVAQVNETLRARGAREVGYKGEFFYRPGTVTINHGIFFRMQAAAVASLIPITTVW